MGLRILSLMTLAVLAASVMPSGANAQSFSFGISSGPRPYYGHHHHCAPPPWVGYSYYRPAPVVVYPAAPPVTYVYPQAPVTVVQPQAAVTPSPVATSITASAPRINSVPLASRSEVTIRNPSDNGGAVAFVVGDQTDAELESGTTRTWSDRASLAVEFDRGANFGAARKVLRPGTYDFVVTEQGWDLVAAAPGSTTTANKPSQLQRNSLPRISR